MILQIGMAEVCVWSCTLDQEGDRFQIDLKSLSKKPQGWASTISRAHQLCHERDPRKSSALLITSFGIATCRWVLQSFGSGSPLYLCHVLIRANS